MGDERLIKIAESFVEKTRVGKISWEETADENTFLTSFTDYSAQVSKYYEAGQQQFRFAVVNSKGRVLESVSPPPRVRVEGARMQVNRFYKSLEELFELARRSALKVDPTLDHILESVQKL